MMSKRVGIWMLDILLLGLLSTTVILLGAIQGSSLGTESYQQSLLVVSLIFEIVLLFGWAAVILRQQQWPPTFVQGREQHQPRQDGQLSNWIQVHRSWLAWAGVASFTAVTVTAVTIVGVTIGMLRERLAEATRATTSLWSALTVIWVLSVLLQTGLIASLVLDYFAARRHAVTPATASNAPEMTMTTTHDHPLAADQASKLHFLDDSVASSPPTTRSGEDSSIRSSMSTLRKAGSLKRNILNRQPSQGKISRTPSTAALSHRSDEDAGFDSWDTSRVPEQMRETVMQSRPTGEVLPTIPGSRSPSPAKALEGPFYGFDGDDSPPISPLPQPPVSSGNASSPGATQETEPPNFTSMFPPATESRRPSKTPSTISYFSRQRSSRPPSISSIPPPPPPPPPPVTEGHIHPLFRTSSPIPPPGASSNTIVTAAPGAGQMVNQRTIQRIRSGSFPPKQSPLVRSESSPDVRSIRPALRSISANDRFPFTNASTTVLSSKEEVVRVDETRVHRRKRSASFETAVY